jgi:hypothetical protein
MGNDSAVIGFTMSNENDVRFRFMISVSMSYGQLCYAKATNPSALRLRKIVFRAQASPKVPMQQI